MLEESGKALSGTVDALRQQPLVLALVLLQGLVLAAVLYSSIHRQTSIDKQFAAVFELLQACVKGNLPTQQGNFTLPLPRPRPTEQGQP